METARKKPCLENGHVELVWFKTSLIIFSNMKVM